MWSVLYLMNGMKQHAAIPNQPMQTSHLTYIAAVTATDRPEYIDSSPKMPLHRVYEYLYAHAYVGCKVLGILVVKFGFQCLYRITQMEECSANWKLCFQPCFFFCHTSLPSPQHLLRCVCVWICGNKCAVRSMRKALKGKRIVGCM